jgi:hypothetical protein
MRSGLRWAAWMSERELTDPSPGGNKLAAPSRAQASLEALIDPVLAPPVVDRLLSLMPGTTGRAAPTKGGS